MALKITLKMALKIALREQLREQLGGHLREHFKGHLRDFLRDLCMQNYQYFVFHSRFIINTEIASIEIPMMASYLWARSFLVAAPARLLSTRRGKLRRAWSKASILSCWVSRVTRSWHEHHMERERNSEKIDPYLAGLMSVDLCPALDLFFRNEKNTRK